jgi:hypothetical protein
MGFNALSNNTGSGLNTAIGSESQQAASTGVGNTSVGYNSLKANATGNNNVVVGASAMLTATAASQSIAIGYEAMRTSPSGTNNIGIGTSTYIQGTNNIALGTSANSGGSGALTNAVAIGANAQVMASNSMVLGSINGINGATADTKVGIGTTTPVSKLNVVGDVGLSDGSTVASNGVVTILLVNRTGAASVVGDIVIADPANDNSFVTTTAAGNTAVIGVVYEAVANGAVCRVAVAGVVDVKANGTILRGQHCITIHHIAGGAGAVGAPGAGSSIGVWLTAPASGQFRQSIVEIGVLSAGGGGSAERIRSGGGGLVFI